MSHINVKSRIAIQRRPQNFGIEGWDLAQVLGSVIFTTLAHIFECLLPGWWNWIGLLGVTLLE